MLSTPSLLVAAEPTRLIGEPQSEVVDPVAEQGPGQEIAVSRVPALGTDGLSAEVYSITTTGTTSDQTTKLYQTP